MAVAHDGKKELHFNAVTAVGCVNSHIIDLALNEAKSVAGTIRLLLHV